MKECLKTFNVKVRPVVRDGVRYAGPIELVPHDMRDPWRWWLDIERAEYLEGQLRRAIAKAKR